MSFKFYFSHGSLSLSLKLSLQYNSTLINPEDVVGPLSFISTQMGNVNVNGRNEADSSYSSGYPPPRCVMVDHEAQIIASDVNSPPHSPPATVSQMPLIFTPQVPAVPLQRPSIPNPSWNRPIAGYEDTATEPGVLTVITWSYGGKHVLVEGSWDDWKTRESLQCSGKDFTLMKVIPSGVYHYRFIVDGQWRHAPDMPWAQDDNGNPYNILDLQDYVPEDTESISGFDPPLSPDSTYDSSQLSSEDFAKEPPLVPPHLQMTVLNEPSWPTEIPPPLSRPQHVVLNHLYMQKGKSSPSVVALGSTHRFRAKYVTVVLYKSIKR